MKSLLHRPSCRGVVMVAEADLKSAERKLMRVRLPPPARVFMKRKAKYDFFRKWSPEMAYLLGYITADGCVIKRRDRINSYVLNITSKDKKHLFKIRNVLNSNHPISQKYNSQGLAYSQIQICNKDICKDLMVLGIFPRKTYYLDPIKVPQKYFRDFVRGFFDGDGTVYIYRVNDVPQIKVGFVSTSYRFIKELNRQLCQKLNIPVKSIHRKVKGGVKTMTQYDICFYINDCEKLVKFMYGDNHALCLLRKYRIFESWQSVKRRHYIKQNYPSKIGWRLNEKVVA